MSLPLRTLGVTALRCARVAPSRTLATTATKRENVLTFLPIIPDPFLPGWNGLAWVFMWRYFGKNKGGPKYASIAKMKYVFITVTLPFLFSKLFLKNKMHAIKMHFSVKWFFYEEMIFFITELETQLYGLQSLALLFYFLPQNGMEKIFWNGFHSTTLNTPVRRFQKWARFYRLLV